jgi:hypothetical protein
VKDAATGLSVNTEILNGALLDVGSGLRSKLSGGRITLMYGQKKAGREIWSTGKVPQDEKVGGRECSFLNCGGL